MKKRKYELLATDLDGTLLNSDSAISEKNRLAIQEAAARGIHIVLCSGRSPGEGVARFGRQLGLNRPGNYYIGCSGAVIVDAADGRICGGNFLSRDTAGELLAQGEKLFSSMGKAAVQLHTTRHIYSRNREKWPFDFEEGLGDQMIPLPENPDGIIGEITKILFLSEKNGYAAEFFRRMQEVLPKQVAGFQILPMAAEFGAAAATKGNAVRKVAEMMGICPENTVRLGDSPNDISMLEGEGLGIAVKNAPADISCHADIILEETNDQDAVAAVLARYF